MPADEQIGAAHGLAAARAGSKLVPGSLGERAVDPSTYLLALRGRLLAQLGFLEPGARLPQLLAQARERSLELGKQTGVCVRRQALLEQFDERAIHGQAAFARSRLQVLLERLGHAGVDDRAH